MLILAFATNVSRDSDTKYYEDIRVIKLLAFLQHSDKDV
jgi:hypothetical protein